MVACTTMVAPLTMKALDRGLGPEPTEVFQAVAMLYATGIGEQNTRRTRETGGEGRGGEVRAGNARG